MKQQDHINGVGECKECDLQASYGSNDYCPCFRPKKIKPPSAEKTLEERISSLEKKLESLEKRL